MKCQIIYRLIVCLYVITITSTVNGLDNGLARRPPMGWLAWARYTCQTNCEKYPDDCISEELFMRVADELVAGGFREAGYEYVNIDDCWSELEREPITKMIRPNRQRFPSGIKSLADYVHGKGLKLGIYTDMGYKTCAGYPGMMINASTATSYMTLDAETYANWTIDSIKVDGCYYDPNEFDSLYPRFGGALNLTGRPILYSCSWPAYQVPNNKTPNYGLINERCNLWRNFDDIEDSWKSVTSVIDFFGDNAQLFSRFHGPGAWFDPDMLIIGNFGLSYDQSRAQMAIWSMLSAPLYISVELRTLRKEFKEILLNKRVIAIDQDPRGEMAQRVIKKNNFEVWVKRIEPTIDGSASFAIVYFYRYDLGGPVIFEEKLDEIVRGHPTANSYKIKDLFDDHLETKTIKLNESLSLKVNPSGSVRMVRLTPQD